MHIIAAKTWLPEITTASSEHPYGSGRAVSKPGTYALEKLRPLVDDVLKNQSVSPLEIDLIVSLSLSADHLVAETNIMGPRLGHPLQKAIGAKNTFVFDLMDSSLSKALYTINAFAKSEQYKNILIIRSEIGTSAQADKASGFCIPDGAAVLLVEPIEHQHYESAPISGNWQPLSMELNINLTSQEQKKITFNYPFQDGLDSAIQQSLGQLISKSFDIKQPLLSENWLSCHSENERCNGPFDIFLQAEKALKNHNFGPAVTSSFDPFGPSIDMVSVIIGAGNQS